MFARYTRYVGLEPARMEPTIDDLATKLLPAMEKQTGCRDGFVLADHQSGCVMSVTVWDTEDQMHASELAAAHVRAEMDLRAIDWRKEPLIDRYEIVLDRNQVLARGAATLAPLAEPAGGLRLPTESCES